jgi:hypothetical protein
MQALLDSLRGFLDITRYYGTDWAAVLCTGVYLWRIGDRKRDAFIWGAAGNVFFIALNTLISSAPGVVFNLIFLVLNARAWNRWSRPEQTRD